MSPWWSTPKKPAESAPTSCRTALRSAGINCSLGNPRQQSWRYMRPEVRTLYVCLAGRGLSQVQAASVRSCPQAVCRWSPRWDSALSSNEASVEFSRKDHFDIVRGLDLYDRQAFFRSFYTFTNFHSFGNNRHDRLRRS